MPIMQVSVPAPRREAPKQKKSGGRFGQALGAIGAIAGGVVGGIAGGPGGALTGASGGMGLGSAAGNLIDPVKITQEGGGGAPQSAGGVQTTQSAISRRMQASQEDPLETLKAAQQAIAALPPEQQAQFQAPIGEALARSQQGNRRFV